MEYVHQFAIELLDKTPKDYYSLIIPSLIGGLLALLGVWLTIRQENKKQRKFEEERRQREISSLKTALASEFGGLLHLIQVRQYLPDLRDERSRLEGRVTAVPWAFSVSVNPFLILESNLSKIGLIDPPTATELITLYKLGLALLEDVRELKTFRDQGRELPTEHLGIRYDQMIHLLSEFNRKVPELVGDLKKN